MRRIAHWKYFCDYFPIKLIKTNELDPNYNYIFGYHPHGIISSGCFGSFGTEGAGFSELFPGIVPHILTLESKLYFYLDDSVIKNLFKVLVNTSEQLL